MSVPELRNKNAMGRARWRRDGHSRDARAILGIMMLLCHGASLAAPSNDPDDPVCIQLDRSMGQHDYSSSCTVANEAATAGSRCAMAVLGTIYEQGLGVAADHETALRWMIRAADAGFIPAQIYLICDSPAMRRAMFKIAEEADDDPNIMLLRLGSCLLAGCPTIKDRKMIATVIDGGASSSENFSCNYWFSADRTIDTADNDSLAVKITAGIFNVVSNRPFTDGISVQHLAGNSYQASKSSDTAKLSKTYSEVVAVEYEQPPRRWIPALIAVTMVGLLGSIATFLLRRRGRVAKLRP